MCMIKVEGISKISRFIPAFVLPWQLFCVVLLVLLKIMILHLLQNTRLSAVKISSLAVFINCSKLIPLIVSLICSFTSEFFFVHLPVV